MAFVFADNLALSKVLMSKKSPSGKYSFNGQEVSYEALNATLAENMRELTHTDGVFDLYKYQENKNTIFSLLSQTLQEVMPKNVMETYGMFADVSTIAQGDSMVFHKKLGKQRAKQFVTRVALAGRYEVFELAEESFTIQTSAYGGAARIGIEEFLDGRVQWSDYLEIVNEGMAEAVYKEIATALKAAIAQFPAVNKSAGEVFCEAEFDRLLATVSVYGAPVIYCTAEAAMAIKPEDGLWISEDMKTERWQNGYFARYKGVPVVILPQSFEDETNEKKVIDPSYIYIFPTNAGKPVKIVFEGQTLVREFENRDWSTELQTYQKFGVGVMTTNNLAVFKLTSLTKDNVVTEDYNDYDFSKNEYKTLKPETTTWTGGTEHTDHAAAKN